MAREQESKSPRAKKESSPKAPRAGKKESRRGKAPRRRMEMRDMVGSMVFAIPFVAVTAVNLRNAFALCCALFTILVPVAVLRFLLQEQLEVPRWLSVPLCALVSLMLASLSYYIIRYVSMEITDALGTYLYLLAAYPVLAAASSEKGIRSMPTALGWGLLYGARFTVLALSVALVREVLAYGQIWGFSLGYSFRVEGAKMTFFGLLLMGIFLAGVNQLRFWAASRRGSRPREQAPGGETLTESGES